MTAADRRSFQVLLVRADGSTPPGQWEFVGDELPVEGAIIDVCARRDTTVVRARVHHIDASSAMPIAAVEVWSR